MPVSSCRSALGVGVPALFFLALGLSGPAGAPAIAQSLLERTPNLNGVEVPPTRSAQFVFLHRFELLGEDPKSVENYPTFVLAVGLPAALSVGATYASNSELGAGTPNEWELWVKRRFGAGERAALAAIAGWNTAAESVDGEITVLVRIARLSVLAAVRGFSDAFGAGEGEAAFATGGALHLTPRLALTGDVARIVTTDSFPTAWSAGVHLVIPGSPHTLGFAVSNIGATTLQNASRGVEDEEGDDNLRYGFAFTMPLGTWGQWARIFRGEEAPVEENVVTIGDFAFAPAEIRIRAGATVRWVNEDQVAHSVTADGGVFDSDSLDPGEGYSRRFDEPGRFAYHCTPHPFMKAVVVVESPGS